MAQPQSKSNNTRSRVVRSNTINSHASGRSYLQSPVPSPKYSQKSFQHTSVPIVRANSTRSVTLPHSQPQNYHTQSMRNIHTPPGPPITRPPSKPPQQQQSTKAPPIFNAQHYYNTKSPRTPFDQPQQQQHPSNWNNQYAQQQHRPFNQQQFQQQQYTQYYYGQWSSNKYYGAPPPPPQQPPYPMPSLPPPPPPPVIPNDDKDNKDKDTPKGVWKSIEQSEEESPSLSSSSDLSDITEGDYEELKLTPVAFGKSNEADKDRLIGILQKLPSDERNERTETSHLSMNGLSLSSLPHLSSFTQKMDDSQEIEEDEDMQNKEEEEIEAEQDATDPEIEIYDDIKTPEDKDNNPAPWETADDPLIQDNEGVNDHDKEDKAPWETSDDDTSIEPILKNADILGTRKLSITVKKEEEEEQEGEDEDETTTKVMSIVDDEKEVSDYDEYLKKQEIEQYEQYIKKHNKKRKKKKKQKKKQHKSPIYIEESMCYDLWDLHELQELEQQRMQEAEERLVELERLESLKEEEEEMEKKKKKSKKKEKKKLFNKKQDSLTPRQRKKRKEEKEAMNLSKSGFRVRVNRRYRLDDGKIGICKFRGRTLFGKAGEDWIGIMVEYGEGEHNGAVDGKNYFRCKDGKGIMVRPQRIIQDLGLPHKELDARTIYDTKSINHLLLYRQRSATSMYD